jgi:hypothetical protein
MSRKLLQTVALASVITASSIVLADDGSGIRIVVPMPAPASRPSEADITSVTDAQSVVLIAQKEAADTHADLARAQADLNRLTRQLQRGLETSGDMIAAREAVVRAKSACEAASRPVLASLSMDADYRQACAALTSAQEKSAEISSRAGASFEERVAAGQAVLNAKAAVGRAEKAALDNDPEVVQAWSRCVAASGRLREVRARLEQAMRQDPIYVAASQAVDDAHDKVFAADKEFAGAKQDLAAARDRVADKQAARQQVADWAKNHGLPEPP